MRALYTVIHLLEVVKCYKINNLLNSFLEIQVNPSIYLYIIRRTKIKSVLNSIILPLDSYDKLEMER